MTWEMSLRDARKEGRQEGLQEGLQTGRQEGLAESIRAVRDLLTPEEIASRFHLSLDTVRSILNNTPNT